MAASEIVNGVDAGKLREAVRAMQANAEAARYAFRAHSVWAGGLQTKTTIKDFRAAGQEDATRQKAHQLEGDEPTRLLGRDIGPNATEAALHALGSCLTGTFMYHAALRNVAVDDLRIDLEGDIDLRGFLGISDKVPVGFENVRLQFHVKSNAPKNKVEELCQLAQRYSPVYNTFTNRTPVTATSVQVERTGASGQGGQTRAA